MELKSRLLERGYPVNSVDSAIERARQIPREKALKKVNTSRQSKGPVFALLYDPRLPPIGNIQAKHWRTMKAKDHYLAEVFKKPPIIAYKRQKKHKATCYKS